jgi:hypothetical protein
MKGREAACGVALVGDVAARCGDTEEGIWPTGGASKTLDGSAACNGAVVSAIAVVHPARTRRDEMRKHMKGLHVGYTSPTRQRGHIG